MFLAFGAWSITDPVGMTSSLGVDPGGPSGVFEMRGVFGGVSLGLAALMLSGGWKPSMSRHALWAMVAYFGGYTVARLLSFVIGDTAKQMNWIFSGFEVVTFLLALALLLKPQKNR